MADLKLIIGPTDSTVSSENIPANKPVAEPQLPSIKVNLKARRTLNGDVIVSDHKDIDFIISPSKMKIMIFVKNGDFSDHVYSTQNRAFEFFTNKGIIDPSTIRGSNVYRRV